MAATAADRPAAGHARALTITRLTLTRFRNHAGLRLDDPGRLVVLAGPNGAGKTNLLEAISMLTPGRGLRGSAMSELASHGGDGGWGVAATVTGPHGEVRLGTGWTPSAAGDEGGSARTAMIDGEAVKSPGALGEHMRVLWVTPAMDRLFAGPASDRRRFLDRLVAAFDPDHGGRMLGLEKTLRERNRLLGEPRPDAAWLAAAEGQLAEHAVAVAAARVAAMDSLQLRIQEARRGDAALLFPWARLEIDGRIEHMVRTIPAVQAEDEYRRLLRDSRRLDRAAGRTLEGPHRSDFVVYHGPKTTPARLCSTGEQKALLIGIVLAHARTVRAAFDGWAPVLLLDEVAAHLDSDRRQGLFDDLDGLGAQVWMTGTDRHLFDHLGARATAFLVENGSVSPAEH